ncbi:hypothetical protein MLD38_013084 [Melastoma candidum]|uniref:Uncharacterized protein n=1 Tax=Melastoma candidum TaxID=119954 RepID=A0ACB9R8I5_9MYRT|nr:hypothetical protein MLD38_013084 [Melastoma candidum]
MASLRPIPVSIPLRPRPRPANLSFSAFVPNPLAASRPRGGPRMMAATASASYAVALADLAKSNNTLEPTSADVEKLDQLFSNPDVLAFFTNPTIDLEKKRSLVDDISSSYSLQPTTANFINILVDANRIDLIKDIVKDFETVYNTITDTELAVVSSVVQLESQHLAQIAKQVQRLTGAKNVRIKTVIDPSLIAGFTVRYGNSGSKLIDLSVRKQLQDLATQLDIGDIKLTV